jgi:heme-degrading monooxygenase HmoA
MFASIRRYRLDAGKMDDLLHLIDTDFAESIADVDGFVAYEVLDCDAREVVTLSVFRDEEAAVESDAMAQEWVRSTLAPQFDITMLDTIHGDVAVSRANATVLEPAHR